MLACLQYVKDTQDTLRRLERSAPALQVALAPDGTEPFGMEVAFDADNLIRAPVDSEVLAMLGTKTTTTRLVGRQLCWLCWQAAHSRLAHWVRRVRLCMYVCVWHSSGVKKTSGMATEMAAARSSEKAALTKLAKVLSQVVAAMRAHE